MTRIFLCRHGETDWNRERRFQGRLDPPLNANGRRQAVALAGVLEKVSLAAVYSSPQQRAHSTAELIAERHGLAVQRDPDLAEIDHGQWNGLLYGDVQARFGEGLQEWLTTPEKSKFPGGEILADVQRRALSVFEAVCGSHGGRNVTILSHDAVIRSILLSILGMPLSSFWSLKQGNTCINVVERSEGGRPRVTLMNDLCHLGGILDPTVQGAL